MRYKIAIFYDSGGGIDMLQYTESVYESDGVDIFIRGRMNALYKGLYTHPSSKIIIGNAPYKEFFMAIPETHPLFNFDRMDDINHPTQYTHTEEINDCKVRYHREFKKLFLTIHKEYRDIKQHGTGQFKL
jgi:hypothetical protein